MQETSTTTGSSLRLALLFMSEGGSLKEHVKLRMCNTLDFIFHIHTRKNFVLIKALKSRM